MDFKKQTNAHDVGLHHKSSSEAPNVWLNLFERGTFLTLPGMYGNCSKKKMEKKKQQNKTKKQGAASVLYESELCSLVGFVVVFFLQLFGYINTMSVP